jgi:hypothetical protein
MKVESLSWEEFQKLKTMNDPILRLNVVTSSMEPLIEVGEKIIIDKTAELKQHDIIVFWQNEKLICHVLWHFNQRLTLGGAPIWATRALKGVQWDLSIQPEHVLGKVINYQLSFWWKLRLRWRDFTKQKRG